MKTSTIPPQERAKQPRYRVSQIKKAFKEVGIKQKDLVEELGISNASLSMVIAGRTKSRAIREAICQRVGLDINRFYPDFYKEAEKEEEVVEIVFKRRVDDQRENTVKQGIRQNYQP